MSARRKDVKCLQCGREFHASKPRVRFCSHNCHDVSRELLNAAKVKQLACAGETQAAIANALGVSRATVQRAIKKYGFHTEWHELRWV